MEHPLADEFQLRARGVSDAVEPLPLKAAEKHELAGRGAVPGASETKEASAGQPVTHNYLETADRSFTG